MTDTVLVAHDLLWRVIRDSKMPPVGHQLIFFALSLEESPETPVALCCRDCAIEFGVSVEVVKRTMRYLINANYLEAIGELRDGIELYRIANRNKGD